MSAPAELPFLNELSSVKVIEMYGPQIEGRLTLSGRMTFKFRNGVYVDTRDEKCAGNLERLGCASPRLCLVQDLGDDGDASPPIG